MSENGRKVSEGADESKNTRDVGEKYKTGSDKSRTVERKTKKKRDESMREGHRRGRRARARTGGGNEERK